MKVSNKNSDNVITIEFYLWEINRLMRMIANVSKAKVDEDMYKKLKKICDAFED